MLKGIHRNGGRPPELTTSLWYGEVNGDGCHWPGSYSRAPSEPHDRSTEIEMNVVRVVALHGIALVYNDWKSKTASEDGRVRESSGKAIEVVRRQPDGRWLFAIDDPFGRSRSG